MYHKLINSAFEGRAHMDPDKDIQQEIYELPISLYTMAHLSRVMSLFVDWGSSKSVFSWWRTRPIWEKLSPNFLGSCTSAFREKGLSQFPPCCNPDIPKPIWFVTVYAPWSYRLFHVALQIVGAFIHPYRILVSDAHTGDTIRLLLLFL